MKINTKVIFSISYITVSVLFFANFLVNANPEAKPSESLLLLMLELIILGFPGTMIGLLFLVAIELVVKAFLPLNSWNIYIEGFSIFSILTFSGLYQWLYCIPWMVEKVKLKFKD